MERPKSALQDWVHEHCSIMMQSVLISAVRAPDGLPKNHPTKALIRWYRRSILISAFDGKAFMNPFTHGGGSFTGEYAGYEFLINMDESVPYKSGTDCNVRSSMISDMKNMMKSYFYHVDEIPHHAHLHLMHAAGIVAFMNPNEEIAAFWMEFYLKCVNDMHMKPETKNEMMLRLSDNPDEWNKRNNYENEL